MSYVPLRGTTVDEFIDCLTVAILRIAGKSVTPQPFNFPTYMRQSHLFTKVEMSYPKDEEAVNAKYLIRAGFVRKVAAGVYAYLPLGLRVLNNINRIIREEMNGIGAEEALFSTLIPREYWEKSGRWGMKVGYEFKSPSGEEVALGWTHEEIAASLATHFISSYKDLPRAVYQIQTKFRDEARAKSGVLRGREFLMKDLYSFHTTKNDLDAYYQKVIDAYSRILARLPLKALVTEAAGGAFTKEYTHEFQVLSPAGEDIVFFCSQCGWAQNKEIVTVAEGAICPKCGKGTIENASGIEVANVFKLGTRYSEAFGLTFDDEKGAKHPVIMGSYGIGPSRLLGTLVEEYHDARGIIWPEAVAPFRVHLVSLGGSDAVAKAAENLYTELRTRGIETLYDDRDLSAGRKLGDADFIGIPYRVVVSEKTKENIEVKKRGEEHPKLVSSKEFLHELSK